MINEINSTQYWNCRFQSGDWEQYDGDKQSVFFYTLACTAMSEPLRTDLERNAFHFVDYGCALGDGTAFLAHRFPSCSVTGIDFSDAAIQEASEKYPQCSFEIGDITQPLPKADVVFSSNTLEHLQDPLPILHSLVCASTKYTILLLPLEEAPTVAEHAFLFQTDMFPARIEDHYLSDFKVLDCRGMNSPYWNKRQLLVVYTNKTYRPDDHLLFDRMYREQIEPLQDELLQKSAALTASQEALLQSDHSLADARSEASGLKTKLQAAQAHLEEKEAALHALEDELAHCKSVVAAQEEAIASQEKNAQERSAHIHSLELSYNDSINRLNAAAIENIAQLVSGQSNRAFLQGEWAEISKISAECDGITKYRVYRLAHLYYRFKRQLICGPMREKKAFFRWVAGSDKDHAVDYNPLFRLSGELANARDRLSDHIMRSAASVPIPVTWGSNCLNADNVDSGALAEILEEPYQKHDVLIFSVINYHFRYQRPQQIADHYAKRGHRVFYINAGFINSLTPTVEQEGNLYIVSLPCTWVGDVYALNKARDQEEILAQVNRLLFRYGIRDALMIADYPTWVHTVLALKRTYGFPLITDYMDDFTGFAATTADYVREDCIRLLEHSQCVAASSEFLVESAKRYNQNVHAIRNGTEFSHFHKAFPGAKKHKRSVIGYYGAIAEWFDAEKVLYLAKRFSDCDIVLIGGVTNEKIRKANLPNLKLLGEKPYAELPDYLAEFDVCLIPFDSSIDLIKATNPVKFYEYLSAGKKIVATEIPELMPFRDKYAYLENDDRAFGDAVERCLKGTDTLAPTEERFRFAKENDWQARLDAFEDAGMSVFPMVSIIVLCYNQLDYTKQCVDSILKNTAYPNYELILVDNCSQDDTADYLRTLPDRDPHVRIQINETNKGFAGGNNDGLAMARGDYLVLLNNDTVVTRGWLTGMLKQFSNADGVGIVGPVTNSIGNEAMVPVTYHEIKDMPLFAYLYTDLHMNQRYYHDGVLAMYCIMFSREVLQKVGPLDENYGRGYFEDDDYSIAAKNAGFDLVMTEDVFIHHYGNASFSLLGDEVRLRLFHENKAYFEKKWGTIWTPHHFRHGEPEE